MIFIVDDDQSVRTALMRLLRSAGYAARAFASLAEFLDDVDAAVDGGGCVIMDMQMPGMTNGDLQAAIKRRTPPMPVIFLTGSHDAGLLARAAATPGVANVLRKPCDSEVLLRAIAAAIGESPPTSTTTAGPPGAE